MIWTCVGVPSRETVIVEELSLTEMGAATGEPLPRAHPLIINPTADNAIPVAVSRRLLKTSISGSGSKESETIPAW